MIKNTSDADSIASYLNDSGWQKVLKGIIESEDFQALSNKVNEKYNKATVFPDKSKIFNAFHITSFDLVKVVILSQDPYPTKGQAHGLCFSVPQNIDIAKIPRSLKNIFKELKDDYSDEQKRISSGDLTSWARNGVFLLNSCLTVEEGKPGSHRKIGWGKFTDDVIRILSEKKDNLVFLLWGKYAKEKKKLIDENKHCILTSSHPSPRSAYIGFFGNKHFSKTNEYLKKHGIKEIDW